MAQDPSEHGDGSSVQSREGSSTSAPGTPDLLASLASLAVHDHVLLAYREPHELSAVVAPFVRLGLERGERCVFFADGHGAEWLSDALRRDGCAVDEALTSGRLVLAAAADALLEDGALRADAAIERLDAAVRQADDEGFTALRIVGELGRSFADERAVENLAEFETQLTRYLTGNDALCLCAYDRSVMPREALFNALAAHPLVIHGGQLCSNHFFVPDDGVSARGDEASLERRLASLPARRQGGPESQRTRAELMRSNADLRAARAELERRMEQRTEELVAVDRQLRAEVTERRAAEAALAHEQGLLHALLDAAPMLVAVLDREGRFVRFSRTCEQVSGHAAEQALGRAPWDLVIPAGEVAAARQTFAQLVDGADEEPCHYQDRWLRGDGGHSLISWTAVTLRDESEQVEGVVAVGVDVTERRALEEELRELALRDDLTDLLNRRGFTTLAEQLLRVGARMGRGVGLLFVDCDNMKRINDRHGHAVGDEALRETAQVLQEAVREADVVGRIGGDEFAVMLVDADRATLERVLTRIAETVRRHNNEVKAGVRVRGAGYKLALSAGGSLFDPQALDPAALEAAAPVTLQQLMDQADRVMYAQKARR